MTFQSAYKVFHSTETSLLKVHNDIVLALDKVENVLVILLDPSAAFDTVNHSLLLSRLQQRYGLCGTVLKWFGSYLCNCAQFVNFNESYSSKCVLSVGVPQGSVLGPVLYLMHKSPLRVLLTAMITITICMLMIVSFTLLLKQMMHLRSKPGLKAVLVIFVVT